MREGYDRWAGSYDETSNPLVALDRRYTIGLLAPRPGELILDAACGTGGKLPSLLAAGSRPIGLDLSLGMLGVARRRFPRIPLVQADLDRELPIRRGTEGAFDACLCALVGEHLRDLPVMFREALGLLRVGGRLTFSVFHPELAAAGIEANFEASGVEYRLGAERHTVEDYWGVAHEAGFGRVRCHEFQGDEELVREVSWAGKYVGRPLLLVLEAHRPR